MKIGSCLDFFTPFSSGRELSHEWFTFSPSDVLDWLAKSNEDGPASVFMSDPEKKCAGHFFMRLHFSGWDMGLLYEKVLVQAKKKS